MEADIAIKLPHDPTRATIGEKTRTPSEKKKKIGSLHPLDEPTIPTQATGKLTRNSETAQKTARTTDENTKKKRRNESFSTHNQSLKQAHRGGNLCPKEACGKNPLHKIKA